MDKNISGDKISVIVPVYNVEEYLGRCLDSIIAQTYDNIEILLIDDGSTDNSGDICDRYSKSEDRVIVKHIANGGVSNARNVALSIMNGQWFCFVDSDDWIEPNYLELLLKNAKENNCSVSGCRFSRDYTFDCTGEKKESQILILNSAEECIHNFICSGLSLEGIVAIKLYNTELYGMNRFDCNLKRNEDCVFTYNVLSKCNKACVSDAQLYHWYMRNDSATHKRKKAFDFEPANVFATICQNTLWMSDKLVTDTLKANYIKSVVSILLCSKYRIGDSLARKARKQARKWYPEVKYRLSKKEQLKFVISVIFWWPGSIIF